MDYELERTNSCELTLGLDYHEQAAEKASVHPSSLRVCPEFIGGANGGTIELTGDFPFVLS